jgi:alpha-glucosidase
VKGPSLRQSLECRLTPKGLALSFGARQGSYRAWWKEIAVTVHGAQPVRMTIADHPRAGKVLIH